MVIRRWQASQCTSVTPPAIYFECRSQVTVGDRACPVAAAKVWNKLLGDVTAME